MEAGEVRAKVLCDWPVIRPSAGLPRSREPNSSSADIRRGFSFGEEWMASVRCRYRPKAAMTKRK